MDIDINFRFIGNHRQIINLLSPIFTHNPLFVQFNIRLNKRFILSSHLLLIVSAVDYLKKNHIPFFINFIDLDRDLDCVRYASRVNFFDLLDYDFQEGFNRHDEQGRFTEICHFNGENAVDLARNIIQILDVNNANLDMLSALDYCLYEVMDNTLNHSADGFQDGIGNGYICAQNFPQNNEVKIMVVDTGVGIHQSLTTHPNSPYILLSEKGALMKSIENRATNGQGGMGFGLYATSEMVNLNGGNFQIGSGEKAFSNGNNTILDMPHWQGTWVYIKIRTNIALNLDEIWGEDNTVRQDFIDHRDARFGNLDDLW